ncbi:MAG: GAF domain-containing protein [Prevotella sp.]|nr:GAF domain-containing protein [Prevotella sp.]
MKENYNLALEQLKALFDGEHDEMAVLSNAAALIKEATGYFWVGFYVVRGDELSLGPFQGSVACMHITYGRGVCGTAWKERRTIVVDDVHQFPGHIACSSLSQSEVVTPLFNANGDVMAVLDVDSKLLADFSPDDVAFLESAAAIVGNSIYVYSSACYEDKRR